MQITTVFEFQWCAVVIGIQRKQAIVNLLAQFEK